jgi:hypothetical protein
MSLNSGELRSLVLECLRKPRNSWSGEPFRIEHLFHEIAEISKHRGLKARRDVDAWLNEKNRIVLNPPLRAPIREIVWDLIVEGILRPGAASDEPFDLPFIHLTEYGKTAIEETVTPYDPDGYVKELKARVPSADDVIIRYISESAKALRQNCLLSSTVTLGCASEKAFLLLSDAYRSALKSADQAGYDSAIEKTRGIKQHHQEFLKHYQKIKTRLKADKDSDWLTGMDHALEHLFSYFRDLRNDAGHPTGTTLSRELVTSHLVIFPYYLRLIYDLIEWLAGHAPL